MSTHTNDPIKRFIVLPDNVTTVRDYIKGFNYNLQTIKQAQNLEELLTELSTTGTRYAKIINDLLAENEALKEGLENYKVTNNRLIEDSVHLRKQIQEFNLNAEEESRHG